MASPDPTINLLFTRNIYIHRNALLEPPVKRDKRESNMIRITAGQTAEVYKVLDGNPKYDAADFIIGKSAVRANADREVLEAAHRDIELLQSKLATVQAIGNPDAKKKAA